MTPSVPLALAWALLVPPLILGAAPLLDGVSRRIRARLEARVGPPLAQGYLDLAKLAAKHEVSAGTGALAGALPMVALVAVVSAGLLLPLGGVAPLGFAGDGIVVLYLLALSSVAIAIAGSASGSPFGALGAGRELVLMLLLEPVVACALFVAALKTGSFRLADLAAWQAAHAPGVSGVLADVGLLLALLGTLGRLPFDLPEAEQELMGGATVEFGGRRLALLRWTSIARGLVVTWLIVEVFAPTPLPAGLALPAAALKVLVLFGAASGASVLFARLRVDHARALLTQVGLLMGLAVVFALVGA